MVLFQTLQHWRLQAWKEPPHQEAEGEELWAGPALQWAPHHMPLQNQTQSREAVPLSGGGAR